MSSAAKSRKGGPRRSSKLAFLHLWLGLTVGLIVAVSGLTGSYLAFYMEIEKAAIAPLRVSPGVRPVSMEAVYQALTTVGSPERGSWSIEMSRDGGIITGRFGEEDEALRMVSVDPATLQIVRDATWGKTLSTWIYEVHYRLLMGEAGGLFMGVLGFVVIAMLGTGWVLWWRSGRDLKSRLAFDPKGSTQRKLYDIHRLLGVTAGVLLVLTISTATAMNLSKQIRPVLAAMSPIVPLPRPASGPPEGGSRLSVDEAIRTAQARFPEGEVRWVQVPNTPTGAYTLRVWKEGEPSRRFPKTYVWVDQYSGRVLAVRDGRANTASDKFLVWLYPLHSGEAFGIVGRTVVAILGLTPLAFVITGFLRWRSKARSADARRRRLTTAKDLQPSI